MKKLFLLMLVCTAHMHAATCEDIQNFFTQAFADMDTIDQKIDTIPILFEQMFTGVENITIQSGLVNPCQPIALTGNGPFVLDQQGATYLLQNNATGGITIDASSVTLDFCGKELSTTGITINDTHNNIIIKNGALNGVNISNGTNTNTNLTIADIIIDGGNIDLDNITKLYIIDCSVCNSAADGIALTSCNEIMLINTHVDNSGIDNITLSTCSTIYITNCLSTNAQMDSNGCVLFDCSNIILHKNMFNSNSRSGLLSINTSNCIINNCQMNNNTDNGISIDTSERICISNTSANNHNISGFSLSNSNFCKLTHCTAHQNATDGISLTSANNNVISNCCAFGNGQHGFNIDTNSSNNCLIDNTTKNNSDTGINTVGSMGVFQRNISVNNSVGFSNSGAENLFTQNVGHSNTTSNIDGIAPVTAFSSGTPEYWDNVEA